MTIPDFADLDRTLIAAMPDADLAETLRVSLDALLACAETDGALELMDLAEVDGMKAALWTAHSRMAAGSMPGENPYEEEETSALQEATTGLLREALDRFGLEGLVPHLAALGADRTLDLITVVENWQTRYQDEGPIMG